MPPKARAKLEALREERDELRAITLAASDAVKEAIAAKNDAERRLKFLRENNPNAAGGQVPEDHPAVVEAQAKLDRATRELAKRREKLDAVSERYGRVGGLVEDIERWLKALPADLTITEHRETIKFKKGERAADVEKIRAERDALLQQLSAVRTAPRPSDQVKAAVRAQVEALAKIGKPDVTGALNHGEEVHWPTAPLDLRLIGTEAPGVVGGSAPNALAVLAWLHKNALLAAIEAEIDANANDEAALTDEQRAAREKQLLAQILENERREEAAIVAAGGAILRRREADPRAVLGLADMPAPEVRQ